VPGLQEAGDAPAKAGGRFARNQANAVAIRIGHRLVLNGFVEIGYITGPIAPRGVVKGSLQDEGELSATMAMLGYDPPGCHFQQSESTAALHGEPMVPYAEPEPAPSHGIEPAG